MLVSVKEMLRDAQKHKYAVCQFNIHNMETIRAVIEVATQLKAPVILAGTPGTYKFNSRLYLQNLMLVAAEAAPIPVAIHLDHHDSIEEIKEGLKYPVNSVMIDGSAHSLEDNIKICQEIVQLVKAKGFTVEGELGALIGIEDDLEIQKGAFTDPKVVNRFVTESGIDTLAVSIGNAHGLYVGKANLDLKLLKEIRKQTDIPLVLHGASDLPDKQVKEAIKIGISKINVATDLKIPFSNGIREIFSKYPDESDPRKFLAPAVANMKKIVEAKILLTSSENRADNFQK